MQRNLGKQIHIRLKFLHVHVLESGRADKIVTNRI